MYGIRSYHASYDPLSYPLFFPRGEIGWHPDIPKCGVSEDQIMAARAARGHSEGNPGEYSHIMVFKLLSFFPLNQFFFI